VYQQTAHHHFTTGFIASFAKGMPLRQQHGRVRHDAYCALLRALDSGVPLPGANLRRPATQHKIDFENVPQRQLPVRTSTVQPECRPMSR
jgi:hypothetical protein